MCGCVLFVTFDFKTLQSTPEQGLGAGNRPNLDFSASPIPAAMSNADIYPHSPANRNLGGGDKTGISAQSSMESGLGLMSSG